MPDRLEIAASGRARCRACRKSIGKGEERFAEATPNPVAEGESQHYYHLTCAADRRAKSFSSLLAGLDPPRPELDELRAAASLALRHHRLERLGAVERSKSARANCRHCREPIEKGAWRLALSPIEDGRLGTWGFLHFRCVPNYVGIKPSAERLTRYSELSAEENAELTAALAALPEAEPQSATPDDDGKPVDAATETPSDDAATS